MRLAPFLVLALAACGGDSSSDTGSVKLPPPQVTIDSPTEGDTYTEGDTVHLKATFTQDDKLVDAVHVVWTSGDWEKEGNDIDVTDLPVGDDHLNVSGLVGDAEATAGVNITIEKKQQDTGHGGGDVNYTGTISAHVQYHGSYGNFGGDCPGAVNLTADSSDGSFSGDGQCTLSTDYGDFPADFVIEGTAKGGSATGTLTMSADGTDYETPFDGTGSVGGKLDVTFDKTFTQGGDSVEISGSWTATPS